MPGNGSAALRLRSSDCEGETRPKQRFAACGGEVRDDRGTLLHGRIATLGFDFLSFFETHKAKNPLIERVLLNRCLVMSYFHMAAATLSSALLCFTSEFGMGSGGSTTLLSPSIFGVSTRYRK